MQDFWLYFEIGLRHVLDINAYDHVLFLDWNYYPIYFQRLEKVVFINKLIYYRPYDFFNTIRFWNHLHQRKFSRIFNSNNNFNCRIYLIYLQQEKAAKEKA